MQKRKNNCGKYSLIIIAIFAIALAIRLLGANDMMYNDEGSRAIAVRDSSFMENMVGKGTAQPPLYSWLVMAVTSLLGMSNIALRITHIIFGMLTIYLVYLFAKRYFDEKAALWATAIMAFSYYHTVASVQITIDGSILAFFYLLSLYCLMRYFDSSGNEKLNIKGLKKLLTNKWLLLAGVGFGLALLTKISAILLIPTIGLYSLVKTRKISRAVFDTSISTAIAALMFCVYLVLSIFDKSGIEFLITRAGDVVANPSTNLALLAIQFMQAAIWIGPLLIGLLIIAYISLIDKKERNENTYLLMIFISIIIFFYVFVIKDNFRPVERYFMAITGPLSIVAGSYLSKIRFEKKHLCIFLAIFLIFSGFLVGLNLKHNDYISFYPKEAFVSRAMSFDWNVYVPLLGNEGPIGFYLSLDSIIYSFLFAFIALAAYILFKYINKKQAVSVLVVFIALGAGFNLIIAEEYLLSATNPDIGKVSGNMIDYANAHDLKKPLFFFRNFALEFYTIPIHGKCPYPLEFWDECTFDFSNENDTEKISMLDNGGTVIVVDFPKINRESLLWKKLSSCKKLQSFYDKGEEIGFIVEC